MRNRIVTAVKQRFSIRKLSIGAASVLLGTSLYFMGPSAPVVHAATEKEKIDTNDPVVVAGDSTKNDADVNNAIDKYAQGKQEKLQGDHAPLIRPSDTQSVTVNTPGDRAYQVGKIRDKIDTDIKQANEQANKDKESIEKYKNDHPQTLSGQDSDFFKNQGLSVGDEKNSEINQISVDHKPITLLKGQSENIDGIHITHADTDKMTDKEKNTMRVNSNNKVIVDFQDNQCRGKEITVTYDNLNNSYYLENKTNRIKISRIDRTFSSIIQAGNSHLFNPNGNDTYKNDAIYDKCDGPQLIIYNDPSDGFFYNNIEQVSVKDIYYDDKGDEITFKDKDGDKNKAWIFVTSLNSDGLKDGKTCRKDGKTYIEKVKAEIKAENSDPTPADIEKLAGSTVTGPVEGNAADTHHGWWYSDEDNGSYNNGPYTGLAWDNNSEDNRYAFVGAVAIKYQPGLTITYGADDNAWGSHWVCTQTQVVSSLNQRVIIYDHIKDGTENVTGNDDVNMTVHYVMDDGSNAPSDSKQTVNFTETGVKDKVTGKIAWTPADSQTLNDVESPVLTGYTANIKTAKGKAVNFGDPDINVTVHYSANAQTAKITYIDDTTKNNLYSQAANGKFGQAITFTTDPTKDIANYEKQGYKLVSNDFKDGTKYKADDKQNEFIVHLTHDKPSKEGSKTPEKPDKPGKGDETKPGKGDETKPGKGDETKPGKGDETKPGKGDETKPGKGDETKPGKGDETKPGKGDETKPGKGDETKPGKGDETKPGKGDETKPGKGDETKPGKGDETKPGKGDETKPGKGDETKPGKGDETKPGKGDETKPGKGDETKPGKGDETKPGKGDETKPGKGDETKPGKGDETKPGKGDETKPGKGDETKPGKGDETKPGKGDETKPGKGDETKPGKGDETKPGKGDETKPGKGDETKPGKGDETKPGKGDETKPGKGDETKPGKEGSKTPEKPIDSRTVDNHVSAKSTAKRELPQTGATINTGIWTGLVSMIASLGLLGASKKRKKN